MSQPVFIEQGADAWLKQLCWKRRACEASTKFQETMKDPIIDPQIVKLKATGPDAFVIAATPKFAA